MIILFCKNFNYYLHFLDSFNGTNNANRQLQFFQYNLRLALSANISFIE